MHQKGRETLKVPQGTADKHDTHIVKKVKYLNFTLQVVQYGNGLAEQSYAEVVEKGRDFHKRVLVLALARRCLAG